MGWLSFSSSLSERLLRCVDHVEEAVVVLLPVVEVEHGAGDGGHGRLVHQEEERLVGVELKAASAKKICVLFEGNMVKHGETL